MNPKLPNCSSSTIDSLRKAGIGLRGGIKTRGGSLSSVPSLLKKKVVAPKIPQKRVKVKKEEHEFPIQSYDRQKTSSQDCRDRGRGRGAKVYIQTEGTLLGDGPALRMKKEREYSSYERGSVSRFSKSSGMKSEEGKLNQSTIDSLLESYCATENYEEYENDFMPIKYPYMKELKKEIKSESIDFEETKQFIKEEPDDESPSMSTSLEGKFFTRIKSDTFPGVKDLVQEIKKIEDGTMMLVQFPSCLPYEIDVDTKSKPASQNEKKKIKEEENVSKESPKRVSIHDLPDGHIGKLQVLKSGKMRLVMGSTSIYFQNGNVPEYLSEVVSIPMRENEGDIIVMGRITQKFVLQPHFSGIT